MFICNNCNKEFDFESEYNRHKNRKTPCEQIKDELECKSCNLKFTRLFNKKKHEKTSKHIQNTIKYNKELKNKIIDNEINKIQKLELEIQNLKNENNRLKELDNKIKILENENNRLKELNNKIIDDKINKIQNLELEIQNLKNENNKIKILENKNKILENENNRLKQNFKMHNNEYIYIIHCAQYINTNIYKIGQTKNIMNRFKQYPKGSEMLFMFSCNNARQIESKILNYLKSNNNYIWYKDAGNEYFQCEIDNLKSDIYNIINS